MMKMIHHLARFATFLIFLTLFVFFSSCAVSIHQKGLSHLNKNEYEPAIRLLEEAEIENPESDLIKRDLGVAYYKTKRFDEAIEKLIQAKDLQPKDGKTIFYLGLAYEQKSQLDNAIEEYKQYVNISRSKHFRRNIAIRVKQLTSEKTTNSIAQALAQEKNIDVQSIPQNSVAVLYFQNLSSSPELDPLQKGLTQMVITDLGKVKQLTVVERLQLQRLLEELELGTSGMVEKESAPRVGKLVGARKLVRGGFTDLADDNLRIDASLAEAASSEVSDIEETTGKLDAIFKLEKDLVFKVIDELGVELSLEERQAIQKTETESLLAFIAYSRGLDFEDRKMYAEAKSEYRKALNLDPGFAMAQKSLEDADLAEAATQSTKADTEELESNFQEDRGDSFSPSKISRLVGTSLAAQTGQVVQGNDTRESVQDATGTDKPTLNNAIVPIIVVLPPN